MTSTTIGSTGVGTTGSGATTTWAEENRRYVDLHLERLRLLLQGSVLRLRRSWGDRPVADPARSVVTDAEVDVLLGPGRGAHGPDQRRPDNGPEDEEVRTAVVAVERAIVVLSAASQQAPFALDVLVDRFGLTPFERDVLLLCLAPELDPAFARLYAYVQDAPHLPHATAALAEDLFGDPGDAWQPASPLLGYRFVERQAPPHLHAPRSLLPLHLDPRIEDFLLGRDRPDPRVRRQLRALPSVSLPDPLREVVAHTLSQLERRSQGSVLVDLVGPAEVGRVVAAELLRCLGLAPHAWELPGVPPDSAEAEQALRLVEREAALRGLGLYVDATRAAGLERVLDQSRVLTVVSTERGLSTDRSTCHARVPHLVARDRAWFWRHYLASGSGVPDEEVDALAQQFELGPEAIGRVVSRARSDVGGLDASALWDLCRDRAGGALDGLGTHLRTDRSWDDLVLPPDAEAQLHEIAAQVAQRARVYDEWGFGDRLARGRGITALFAGPSGTGKTLAAEVLATHLRLDLCRVDLAGVVSKYIGETEKNLQRVFDTAEEGGWILFFDEADALFGRRTEVKDSHDRYANIEVNYLLQRMEQYRGLAILATNRRSALDRAFLRRIRFLVDFPLPGVDDRRRIWMRSFPPRAPLGDLDLDRLARLEMTGANITTVTTNAAFLAAGEDSRVEMHHIAAAIRREYAKLEQLLPPDGSLEGAP